MSRILVFAYGSNMCTGRIRKRTPSATAVATGYVTGRALRWNKESKDGSGKCNMTATGDATHCVWGVIFQLAASEKPDLDKAEGLGRGYFEETVAVHTKDGVTVAKVYVATQTRDGLRPYDWYKDFVVAGAHEHGLPADYIRTLDATEAIPDPDRERCARERSVLGR